MFAGSRMEFHGRADVAVWSLKSAGWKIRQGFYIAILRRIPSSENLSLGP